MASRQCGSGAANAAHGTCLPRNLVAAADDVVCKGMLSSVRPCHIACMLAYQVKSAW